MKYKYNISNLDCANCAAKIEEVLNKDENIKSATVNFSNLKLTIETDMKNDVLKYITKIARKIEPDVILYENEVKEENIKSSIIRLILGTIIGVIGLILPFKIFSLILSIIALIILLSKTALKAIKLLIKDKTLNENFLITISCIGAFIIDKMSEGLMVIILYEIGKILEAKAVNNSRKSISSLINIKPLFANIKTKDGISEVKPEKVNIGDIIVVKTGEKVPLDGIIIKGNAKLNTSSITGESKLKSVKENDNVISGVIVEDGVLEIKVTSDYENSIVFKMLELVENATDNKAKTENFVSKVAKIYTPLVFLFALLLILFGVIFTNVPFNTWFYRGLVFLVISCPCAIAISVPLSYFAGIGASSKNGILIKGSNYLDSLRNIKKIIFDKTGTITTGKFEDIKITILDKKYKKEELEKIIYKGENLSTHPIAKSIVKYLNLKFDSNDVKNFKEYKGKGISYEIDKNKILIGNNKLCKSKENKESIYVSINNNIVAKIDVQDKIKDEAKEVIKNLKDNNINVEMFTGDSREIALSVGEKIGIDSVKYELLPTDKYNLLDSYIKQKGEVIAFVGDGINDAATLALSHIGISMGSIGTDVAIEASDVVIMTDTLEKIQKAIDISKYTSIIVKENLLFAITTKIIILVLSALGLSNMFFAVFADVGVTLITILNTTRILKKYK